MFKKGLSLFLLFFSIYAVAQKHDSSMAVFKNAEHELQLLLKETFYSKVEKERLNGNKKFMAIWDKIISNPKILDYSFDSLKKDVSIQSPKDKKFKLITWDYHKDDGTFAYFGYLLVNNSKRIKKGLFKHETVQGYEFFQLIDCSPLVKNPETYIGFPGKWFGMLYVDLIETDGYYALLGWDGNNKITQRKFVDVLYFKSDGTPVFGRDIFRIPKKNPKRMMFEWSSDVTMSLKFNEKKNMIIYSHLAPKQGGGELEGQFQFYGPDLTFDALELKNGKWNVIEDIDARNEKSKNDKKKHAEGQTPITKPK